MLPVIVGVLTALLGVKPLFWLYAVVALAVVLSIRRALAGADASRAKAAP